MYQNEYKKWANNSSNNSLLRNDIKNIKNERDIDDRFFKELEFGTGGLRGKIGLGTNRINHYVVRRATLGLADTLLEKTKKPSVAIAYDSRNYSKELAKEAAVVLASKGIKVHLVSKLTPTPVLSFMVRQLKCDAGIVITASHNPKEYNGYKVYGDDGVQITLNLANRIYKNIKKHDYFEKIDIDYNNCIKKKKIVLHYQDIFNSFIKSTMQTSICSLKKKNIKILYTPLNGAGYKFVTALLNKEGYKYKVIEKQAKPDGNFSTCPKPNPELYETMIGGIKEMEKIRYDILFATDPDSDRCGVAINDKKGTKLLSGDEIAILLFDFVYQIKKEQKKLGITPTVIKTIATTDLIHKMAQKYHVRVIDTLTGFKFIGEQLEMMTNSGKGNDFLIALEDSCGYLTNKDVRDKDAINAALLIAEMANYYKQKDMTLLDRLNQIYKEFGHYTSCLKFIELEGEEGLNKINQMMKTYRSNKFYNDFLDCTGKYDYLLHKGYGSKAKDKSDLPTSDVIKFYFRDGSELLVRPSGTEPKIKFYYLTPNRKKEKIIENKLLKNDITN